MWTGNRLSSIEIDGLDEALAFSYNADGVRNGKTYWDKNGIPTYHRYTVDGNRIISETVSGADNYTLYYLYGANGGIEGFIYNNTYYYFQKNIQGDIIRICNCLGETVVEYGYDVWGTVTSVTGDLASTIGQINPFRYRGYYYDAETGWYYLNARYYDPNVGRFLSPDVILGANGGLQGYNLFAYCNNNPVMFVDPDGAMMKLSSILDKNSFWEKRAYVPQVKLNAIPICPEPFMGKILEADVDATTKQYIGSSVEGSYLVHRFSDMEYVGTIADYYFEMSDNRAKSRSLMNKAATLSKIISFMDVSNGGGPFVDTPNFPYVAVIFNCLSALQPLVEHQREKMLEEAEYYQNKPDEYELKYVRIINHVGPFQIGKVMIYV